MVEMTPGLERFLLAVLILHALCMLGGMIRAALGPRFTDRVVAVNLTGTAAVLMLCILSYLLGAAWVVDVAILYALLNMAAVVVLCRIARVHHTEHRRGSGEEEP